MMIVLMIISILLMIAVPKMTSTQDVVETKSIDATVQLVQSQVAAYQMDHDGTLPESLETLVTEGYVDSLELPGDKTLTMDANGNVSVSDGT